MPNWQVDKEEERVVHGGRGGGGGESLKHQAIPVCGAVSIGPAYCLHQHV